MEIRNAFLLVLFVSQTVMAAPTQPLRLIETAPDQRQWMTEDQIWELSRAGHRRGVCGGFMDVTDTPESFAKELQRIEFFSLRGAKKQSVVQPLLKNLSVEKLNSTIQTLSAFHNRYYDSDHGKKAALWIEEQFKSIAKGRSDIEVSTFAHSFKQPSVIARIPGKKESAAEKIIIGAHEDSINHYPGFLTSKENARAPGADDDASGVATVLEVFRVIVESGLQPERTLEFMTYAGEEKGLLGSQEIAKHYFEKKEKVVAVVHFDMTMYAGSGETVAFVTDHVDPDLTRFVQSLNDEYVKAPWKTTECGYACSDHASWRKYGFSSVYPFEASEGGMNPQIHTTKDTKDNKGFSTSFGLQFAKIGLATLVELSFAQ